VGRARAADHRPATSGCVTGTATTAHAGQTLVTCDVVITGQRDRRVCTARVTSMLAVGRDAVGRGGLGEFGFHGLAAGGVLRLAGQRGG
jgi:hypothetical protein